MARLAVFAILLFGVASADDKPEEIDAQKLIGKWQLAEGFDGLTIRVEFTRDGKMLDTIDGHGVEGLKIEGVSEHEVEGAKIVSTSSVGEK